MSHFESEFTRERIENLIDAQKKAEGRARGFRRKEYGLWGLTALGFIGAVALGTFGLVTDKKEYLYSGAAPFLLGYASYVLHTKKTVPAEDRLDLTNSYLKDGLKTLTRLVEEGRAVDNERAVFIGLIERGLVEQEDGHNQLLKGTNARRARAILPYNGDYQHDPEATDGWLDEFQR